jgi:hypothetical protein
VGRTDQVFAGGDNVSKDAQVINVDVDDKTTKPVVINAENGSVVTVNVNVKHYHGMAEWFGREDYAALLEALKGR